MVGTGTDTGLLDVHRMPPEPCDDELVAGAEEGEHSGQLRPADPAATRHPFRPNDRAPLGFELGELNVELLVSSADAGVTDAGHVSPRGLGPRLPCHK